MAIYLESLKQYFASFFAKKQTEEDRVSKIEAYISVLYKLLIWDDPVFSALSIVATHMLFWVILHFQLRLYGVFFLALLIFFLLDASLENVVTRTEKPIPLKSIRESLRISSAVVQYLTTLRKEHPGTFCVGMCIGFVSLSIIGRTISGLVLTYIGFLSIVLMPGLIKSLPPQVTDGVKQAFLIISSDEGFVNETELLPTGYEEEEGNDDGESTKTDRTAESCANSFISGVTSMPSYLDAEGSLDDGIDEDELELLRNARGVTPSSFSADSSDSENKDIKFESTHFNKDSSSSSDEDNNYEQGLTFSETDDVDKSRGGVSLIPTQIGAILLSNLGGMGSSLVNSMLRQSSPKPAPVKKSDSDSDFEIINTDEFQNSET